MMCTATGRVDVLLVAQWHFQRTSIAGISVPVTLSDGLPGTGMPAERVCGGAGRQRVPQTVVLEP